VETAHGVHSEIDGRRITRSTSLLQEPTDAALGNFPNAGLSLSLNMPHRLPLVKYKLTTAYNVGNSALSKEGTQI
jgi:hypothetical protein